MAVKNTPPSDGDLEPIADDDAVAGNIVGNNQAGVGDAKIDVDDAKNGVDDKGLTAQLSVFVGDVVNMAQAELNYYRTRFAYSQSVAKRIGLFAIISVATFFAAIAAFIFGLLLILATYLGPAIATIIVTVAFLGIAVVAGLSARKATKSLSFRDDPSDD
jgi:hypothetical protein